VSWTYSGDPATSDRDAVRFWVGDVDTTRELLSDQEIDFLLTSPYDSVLLVAAQCAEVLAGRYAGEVSVSTDGTSVATSELQNKYEQLATSLRDQYKESGAGLPFDSSSMWPDAHDPSIKPLNFGVGFMDNAWAGSQSYGDYHPSEDPTYPEGAVQ